MDLHHLLKARFAMVRRDLDMILDRISDEDLGWRPAEGLKTIREQLREIADKEIESLLWVERGEWPDEYEGSFADDASLSEIRVRLAEIRAETYAYLDERSEAELHRIVRPPELWLEALRLPGCPLDEVLRNIAAHEWYHAAQLVIYLGLRGDVPDRW